MNSKIIFIAVILFSMAINGCKEEKQEDLTIGLVGTYSGEFTWTTNLEVKKGNGIVTIIKVDETHVKISDDIGLYLNHLNFMDVYAKELNGTISFYQNIKSPGFENPLWGTNLGIDAHGSKNDNGLYLRFNGIYFNGNIIQ